MLSPAPVFDGGLTGFQTEAAAMRKLKVCAAASEGTSETIPRPTAEERSRAPIRR